ncbi:Uncharacterised protein [Vibrio cholerae]|nr:Uncharacterised protein [Vibrio cholerae]
MIPVCESISGIAICKISLENKKLGSRAIPLMPPRLPFSGVISICSGSSSKNQMGSF